MNKVNNLFGILIYMLMNIIDIIYEIVYAKIKKCFKKYIIGNIIYFHLLFISQLVTIEK